jgi:hypothetical protein
MPRFAARRTFFLVSCGNLFSHQSLKHVAGIAAQLSHSKVKMYFGVISGSFCGKQKMSARNALFSQVFDKSIGILDDLPLD